MMETINFNLWMRVHTLPRFFIERWQLRELKSVITDAYHNVPLYKALCDEKGVCPKDINTLADIQKFPITSKELFRKHPLESFVDQRFLSKLSDWYQTSGSTGELFRFPLNTRQYFKKKFKIGLPHIYLDRYLYWRGFSLEQVIKNFRITEIRMKPTPRAEHYLHIATPDLQKDPDEIFEKLRDFRTDVIESRPTLLVELARLAENDPTRKINFQFAYANGEVLTESQRTYIERGFGCEVYSRYGLEECWGVAVECSNHKGLHISEESFLVEILDSGGRSLPPGTYGRVIITHFYNRTLPFIRYETGDYGTILPGICPCGLWARRLIVKGRIGGFFTLGNRRFNFAEFQTIIGNFYPYILRYQLAKVKEDKLELRIVPTRDYSPEIAALLKNDFGKKFDVALDIKSVSNISYPEGGKTRFIIDETSINQT